MKRVLVLSGPNLNLLGTREPEVYGRTTLPEMTSAMRAWATELGIEVDHVQSNHEGELIDRIHASVGSHDGLVINPGALTHSSHALHDALSSIPLPAVEVHISNIRRRESWRRRSVIAPACVYSIYGRGLGGYRWALRHLVYRARFPSSAVSYGSFPDQVGDLRRPNSAGRSLVVLVHGGLWREEWTRDTMDGLAVSLVDSGYVTWNLEYRRIGTGGGWPESFADVARAILRAEDLIGISASQTVVIGHSAGGTMALWAAGESTKTTSAGPALPKTGLVVGLAAITDLIKAERDGLGDGAALRLIGRRRPEADEYSPRHRLPTGVPSLLASGLDDGLVGLEYGRDFAATASLAGDEVELLELNSGHLGMIDPEGEPFQAVADGLRSRIPPL